MFHIAFSSRSSLTNSAGYCPGEWKTRKEAEAEKIRLEREDERDAQTGVQTVYRVLAPADHECAVPGWSAGCRQCADEDQERRWRHKNRHQIKRKEEKERRNRLRRENIGRRLRRRFTLRFGLGWPGKKYSQLWLEFSGDGKGYLSGQGDRMVNRINKVVGNPQRYVPDRWEVYEIHVEVDKQTILFCQLRPLTWIGVKTPLPYVEFLDEVRKL